MEPLLLNPFLFPTPERKFHEAIEIWDATDVILVLVWPDDYRRAKMLRDVARERGMAYQQCQRYRTSKQFTRAIAQRLGLDSTGREYDIDKRIYEHLSDHQTPFILDDADLLTRRQFRGLRGFYDVAKAKIIIAGSTQKLHDYADDQKTGGQFLSRSWPCAIS